MARKVLCVEDNRVFKSMTAAEKEYGIPLGTLSYALSSGNNVVSGKTFEYAETSKPVSTTDSTPINNTDVEESSTSDSESSTPVPIDDTRPMCIDIDAGIEFLTAKGYDCAEVDGVLMVFETDPRDRSQLDADLQELNYRKSWGCTLSTKEAYMARL